MITQPRPQHTMLSLIIFLELFIQSRSIASLITRLTNLHRYEVFFQNGIDCGGGYMKLLSQSEDLRLVRALLTLLTYFKTNIPSLRRLNMVFFAFLQSQFNDATPYTIMFGPDKCGSVYKIHFIFRHRNPLTGVYEEKHSRQPEINLSDYFTDQRPHLYTLCEY